jgi:hypothetical protein
MHFRVKFLALSGSEWREIEAPSPDEDDAPWYVVASSDAVLNPELTALLQAREAERPDVDIFYGDEVSRGAPGEPWQYLCKPSFDQAQFLAQNYIGLPLVVRRRAMTVLGSLDAGAGTAQCYDLLLRAFGAGLSIERITEVLAVSPVSELYETPDDSLAALRRAVLQMYPGSEVVPGLTEASFEFRRKFEDFPDVTLVIPTRQMRRCGDSVANVDDPMVLKLLSGICQADWPMDRIHVLIGDDQEDGAIYASRAWPFKLDRTVTRRPVDEAFNYAKKINRLWRAVGTEHLIILNDDLMLTDAGWIRALMTFAMEQSVGGVGARLLFPDGTIQHVGMPIGVLGPCTHAFISTPASRPTYQNWAVVHREWSAVTGAVFATRRSVLEQVNGFDERFALNYNDVDLCLRLRSLGYRIIYTPHAEMTHFESASRGKEPSPADQTALFMEKWRAYLEDDPAYHPRLTRETPDIRPVLRRREWWSGLVERAGWNLGSQ